MREHELAFAAGFLEGEGTVRINTPTSRNRGHLAVSVVNTDRSLVDWFQQRWPGYCKPASGMRPDQRQAYVWTIAARRALAFLEEIEPYVVSRRMKERIDTAKRWQALKAKPWRLRTDEDDAEAFACYHWMRHLNTRGPEAATWA